MSKFDATLAETAKKLKKETHIVPMHRTMDGALNGYSVIKSVFDIQHCTESQIDALDAMHEWIATPTGLILTLGTSALFTACAYRAGKDEIAGKNTRATQFWGDAREALQAGRNGFKAVRGGIFTAAAFTTKDLSYTILPSGLGFGGFYMANRLYMRWENEKRKKMVKANQHLFAHLMNYGTFLNCEASLPKVEEESHLKNCCVRVQKPSLKFIHYDKQGKPSRNKKDQLEYIKNKYIIYKSSEGKEKLYYVDYSGEAEFIPDANIAEIKDIIKKTGTHHLSLLQLSELLPLGLANRHFEALKKEKVELIPLSKRRLYYLIRAFNGLIDGMYLYLGIVLGVATFSPHVLLILTMISALYCLLCIVSRVYEEYQTQQQLLITEYKIDLAKAARALELCLSDLNKLTYAIALEKDHDKRKLLEIKQKKMDEELEKYLKAFEEKRHFLRSTYYLSKTETVLLGIKHALPFYGALISFLFALVFIGFMVGFTIPPLGVIITVAAGLPIIAIGVRHAFKTRLMPPKDLFLQDKKSASELSKIVQEVKASFKLTYKSAHEEYEAFIKGAYAKKAFLDWVVKGLQADPLADTYYADYAEIGRSFWAGLSKGRKAIEMILNRWQQQDKNGHYQDTFVMYVVIVPFALVYAIVFAMNAFIKGLSRKDEDKENFEDQELDIAALEKQRAQHTGKKRHRLSKQHQASGVQKTGSAILRSDIEIPTSHASASTVQAALSQSEKPSEKYRPITASRASFSFFKPEQQRSALSLVVREEDESADNASSVAVLQNSEDFTSGQEILSRPSNLFLPISPSQRLLPPETLAEISTRNNLPSPIPGDFSFDPMSMCLAIT